MGTKPAPRMADYGSRVDFGQVVDEHDAVLLRLLVLTVESDYVLMDNVAVAPEAQGTGIGIGGINFALSKCPSTSDGITWSTICRSFRLE